MLKQYKRNLLATVISAFILVLAFPTVVIASTGAAITSLNMDRTSVTQGQAITISVRATPAVNYVFVEVDNERVQGTLQSANTWQIVVRPNRTQNITVVASETNSVTDAAMANIPITVTGAATQQVTTTPPTIQPGVGPPLNLLLQPFTPPPPLPPPAGNMAIHSITETEAIRENYVRLTVVTGIGAYEVWAQFDGERFRRAQEQTAARTETTRTWTIDFRPQRWAAQTIQVSANREYRVAGAVTQEYELTLAAPFVPPIEPHIQSVSVSPRTVDSGGSTTFTIRTNQHVNYVWIIDADGNRRDARRSGTATATARNWSVTFNPGRTGTVTVYANTTNTTSGAVTRTENVTVQVQNVAILSPTTARWSHQNWWDTGWNSVVVEVTTNQFAEHVWVQLPNGNTHSLSRISGTGTANRTWRVEISNVGNITSLQVHASDVSGTWSSRDSRTVTITGQYHGHGGGWVSMPSGSWVRNVHVSHTDRGGGWRDTTVNFTTDHLTNWFTGAILVYIQGHGSQWATSTNGVNWTVTFSNIWFDSWHSRTITFADHTGIGLHPVSGTLTWN
ncbi:MAG: hypothetical protein FWC32_09435 [Firmicutes bacterium]|nr:hypothetical protein [Bacillota bacterium]